MSKKHIDFQTNEPPVDDKDLMIFHKNGFVYYGMYSENYPAAPNSEFAKGVFITSNGAISEGVLGWLPFTNFQELDKLRSIWDNYIDENMELTMD